MGSVSEPFPRESGIRRTWVDRVNDLDSQEPIAMKRSPCPVPA